MPYTKMACLLYSAPWKYFNFMAFFMRQFLITYENKPNFTLQFPQKYYTFI